MEEREVVEVMVAENKKEEEWEKRKKLKGEAEEVENEVEE